LGEYLHSVEQSEELVKKLEKDIEEMVESSPLKQLITNLQAAKGIKLTTAAGMVVELGDMSRFNGAPQVMGYAGMGVRENSTGNSIHRGGITKTGNSIVRFLAAEAAHHYRLEPRVGPALEKRQEGISEEIKDIAWKAQRRLHRRFWRLMSRGLSYQEAVVEVARELLGSLPRRL
jgi:transposase